MEPLLRMKSGAQLFSSKGNTDFTFSSSSLKKVSAQKKKLKFTATERVIIEFIRKQKLSHGKVIS